MLDRNRAGNAGYWPTLKACAQSNKNLDLRPIGLGTGLLIRLCRVRFPGDPPGNTQVADGVAACTKELNTLILPGHHSFTGHLSGQAWDSKSRRVGSTPAWSANLFQRCAVCLSGRVLDSRLDVSLH